MRWSFAGPMIAKILFLVTFLPANCAERKSIRHDPPPKRTPSTHQQELPDSNGGVAGQSIPDQPPPCSEDCVARVYVSPGTFSMGSDTVPGESKPRHSVTLTKGFWLDKYEVSQQAYAKCVSAKVCPRPEGSFAENSARAVYGITWQTATKYCQWAGKRLPTEAEWERAACKDGIQCYPWGGVKDGGSDCSEKPTCEKAAHCLQSGCAGGPCYDKPRDINEFETAGNISPFGAVNMGGNVWEWVQDSWTPNFSWCQMDCTDPLAPSSSEQHVMKGGSWISEEVFLRCSARYHDGQGGFPSFEVGIRCAQDALP